MTHLQKKLRSLGETRLQTAKKKSLFWGLAQKINNPGSGKDRSRDLSKKKHREKKNTLLSDQSTKRKIYSKNDKE